MRGRWCVTAIHSRAAWRRGPSCADMRTPWRRVRESPVRCYDSRTELGRPTRLGGVRSHGSPPLGDHRPRRMVTEHPVIGPKPWPSTSIADPCDRSPSRCNHRGCLANLLGTRSLVHQSNLYCPVPTSNGESVAVPLDRGLKPAGRESQFRREPGFAVGAGFGDIERLWLI